MKIFNQISHRFSIHKALVFPFLIDLQLKKSMKRDYFSMGFTIFSKLHLERYFLIGNGTPSSDTIKMLFWPVGILSLSSSVISYCTSIFVEKCKIFPHFFPAHVNTCSLRILFVLLCHLWTDWLKILLNFKFQKKFAKQRKLHIISLWTSVIQELFNEGVEGKNHIQSETWLCIWIDRLQVWSLETEGVSRLKTS